MRDASLDGIMLMAERFLPAECGGGLIGEQDNRDTLERYRQSFSSNRTSTP
jgi:hypothetical protein